MARCILQGCDVQWAVRLLDVTRACEPKENIFGTFFKCDE